MRVLTTIAEMRSMLDKERETGRTIGFVPTMGYLHDGHASLMMRARWNDVVVVSIFVNPLQFGANEDLDAYPRDLDRDLEVCAREGVSVVFHPSVDEMYPHGRAALTIDVGEIGTKLCGASRPGHFNGVATVVSKLFNIVGPCNAYFGEKDAQQLVVIRDLARDLDFPVRVSSCPTVREPDGLALSSRNKYLNRDERRAAIVLKRTLDEGAALIGAGERDARRVAEGMRARISSEPLARLDYAECVDTESLDALETIEGRALLVLAAWFGKARLIDNVTVTPQGASIEEAG